MMNRNQENKADGGKLMMALIPTSAIKRGENDENTL